MIVMRSPDRARASSREVSEPTAYNEGWARGADVRGALGDCPYLTPLVRYERAEWLRGFAAGRQDRRG
ncbi:hypothetical protein ACYZX9_09285 [Sphingomonas citri]|jgi:hypothetical protein|uniref:Uncharacterized protein n=1 Tax=Sphingomonas citri TaxID=2862499 RepID=A0ABS7BQ63_9SPHN|nr:hypothetical protein [Sphingomonas citri]MBW6531711.1 hypothetical protein [Sphingomonas citri]